MSSCSQEPNLLVKRKPEDGLETEPVLKKRKEKSEENEIESRVELLLLSDEKSTTLEQETVETTEPVQEPKRKTLFVSNLPAYTKVADILCFFEDVGQVVRVRLVVNDLGVFKGDAFVEFASAHQANKALEEKKNDKFLNWRNIFLDVANKGEEACFPPKYCIDHKVWYLEEEEDYLQQEGEEDEDNIQQVEEEEEEDEDYLQQESLPIEEEEDETPPNAEEDSVLFMANLSPQTTKISQIIKFFKYIGGVVSVRLIVNQQRKHVGYAFVEFVDAKRANLALKNKNGEYLHDHEILLMRRVEEDTPHSAETATTVRDKTLFVDHLSTKTRISNIINFFKDVGEVVHVRLMVDKSTVPMRSGYVEFASAAEAEKAMEEKNGKYLNRRKLYLAFVKEHSRFKYCIDHKVWFEDYLQRESLLLQENASVDETPDFDEDVSSSKKTLFTDFSQKKNVPVNIPNIISFFEHVGEVASVRLIVDRWGISSGCCCVEFATGTESKKGFEIYRHVKGIFVKRPEIAPYPFRPKYNLTDLAEKLWCEDELRREGFGLPTRSKPKEEEEIAIPCKEKVTFCGKKITFSDEDDEEEEKEKKGLWSL
ncbi:RNA-binding (RRM/RBD/RNP motifs) family protein [Raphanus sativus]|nr:RNA-binding (RRM/RBD/RNP motifs) family protein [Raphanus sativus]